MKRRTLDLIFVVGGVAMAVLLAILGMVMKSNANFADDYVTDQLSEQQIYFKPLLVGDLPADKKASDYLQTNEAWKNDVLLPKFSGDTAAMEAFIAGSGVGGKALTAEADSECLQKYGKPTEKADRLLNTGKEAECYANDFIRLHVKDGSIVDGVSYTYATISGAQGIAQKAVDEATKANPNDPAIADLQKKVDGIKAQRETLFKGESLRGLLLTSYGFSVFGEKADLAATVCYLVALVLLLASIAGLIHALKTPKTALVGHHETTTTTTT